eukprot:1145734-Pelagomonas_calceolata.AAC.4
MPLTLRNASIRTGVRSSWKFPEALLRQIKLHEKAVTTTGSATMQQLLKPLRMTPHDCVQSSILSAYLCVLRNKDVKDLLELFSKFPQLRQRCEGTLGNFLGCQSLVIRNRKQ